MVVKLKIHELIQIGTYMQFIAAKNWNFHLLVNNHVSANYTQQGLHDNYSGILISWTSRGNANWFEKLGVREIEGGIKLRLIGWVLFGYE